MTITDILRNEITIALGHTPSKEDQEYFINYIHDGVAEKINAKLPIVLKDISLSICLCREECFMRCEECGQYFLPKEMNGYGQHKCLECEPFHDPDAWKD